VKRFDRPLAEVGLTFGLVIAAIGVVGPLIAGPLADWLQARFKAGRLYVTLAALLVSPILGAIAYSAPRIDAFYLIFIPYGLILTMWIPPIYATLLDLALPRIRGSVFSFSILSMTIVGMGLGPYAVGVMSEASGGDIGGAIVNLYWLSPVIILLTIYLIVTAPHAEARLAARARAAGEPI
jgi:MFS family permease